MTATPILREDHRDTKRALAHHVSGDEYVVVYCSLWDDDDHCVGTRIIASAGPISRTRDLGLDGGPLEATPETFDAIDRFCDDGDRVLSVDGADAAWLQEEEDAGRLTYPIGAR